MTRVLVVDDSTFMRNAIVSLLEQDPEIKVVGTARDGLEALQKAEELDADVMTLDVEMPRLDGLGTLQRLMKTTPMPVLMISSLTESGAESTLKALEYGALDFIPKNMSNDRDSFGSELRRKVTALARRKAIIRLKYRRINNIAMPASPLPRMQHSQPADYVQTPCHGPRDLVVVGVSTGGPPVVQKILSALPADMPACILVAQHMPAAFTGPFAKRLDSVCNIRVTEAVDGDRIKNGHAYVCPGGKHISVRMRGPLPEVAITEEPRDALYKPTVNLLMESAGKNMGRRTLGVMLTGMGSDGCEGAKILREKGGCLIAQNEASCVVYGMPKAVIDAKLANQILDADDIAQAIMTIVKG
ncbi:chemotaxis response regulator protein-glutamate methylesterase [Desulfovibrio sp. 86]|uniref:Protein-glutamate methylesterase/protein-glutamine glutaminase n=1 Tax=uncultured Desulfovibrio sp. TaxID=167968 RepID=A0A212KXU3_9BACT|nr:chemotaxis response regulator protein-glutamate methylesterase [Desulfovibrio sp. 86]SCM70121.1 Chemotaxis response regulator protein-glutamate methylesterase of group 2 operon [uncultured Desulfovibrio sp.]VZH35411.1 Chemotaxis response regulator protein-glutamate methylesterase of group 1 operon [Desulfovibrio sp. 86]